MPIAIGGERSGAGKTTITLALLAALRQRQISVQSFKVGPDYIDPMFHTSATGRPCRNLDPVLTSEAYVQECFATYTQTVDCALVEGVMGLFDGAGGTDFASTAHIARLLDLSVLFVIDCARLSRSVAAIALGYRSLDLRLKFAGVILNRVGSDRHLEMLKEALASIQVPIMGVFRREDAIAIPDRHLGLIPTEELPEWNGLLDRLAHLGMTCFDWQQLLPLLEVSRQTSPKQTVSLEMLPREGEPQTKVRIAIARDRAFSFYYADNLDALVAQGAELVFWSPLHDTHLPENIQGLYLGGGFPEVFAAELSENVEIRKVLNLAIRAGMPTYAECGGMMVLCEGIVDFQGQHFPMVGLLPTAAVMTPKLTLGYRRAEVLQDSPIAKVRTRLTGHEFHRSHLTHPPTQPLLNLRNYVQPLEILAEGWGSSSPSQPEKLNLHASYLHLHWGASPDLAQAFVSACRRF